MITEAEYIEIMKNCSNWNSRVAENRKQLSYDPQTGRVHRSTDHLFRHSYERCIPMNRMQVYTYASKRWIRPKGRTVDALEMNMILRSNPAIGDAANNFLQTSCQSNEDASAEQKQPTPSRSIPRSQDIADSNLIDYEFEEFENEQSDEDEWGSKKKRRKGTIGANPSSRSKKLQNIAPSANFAPTSQISATSSAPNLGGRPFTCQRNFRPLLKQKRSSISVCGAKYKSRPGLNYHRIHVHGSNELPKSPSSIPSPKISISTYCDLCLGTKNSNSNGKSEDLVSCHDCGRSGHPTCLKFTQNMVVSTKRHGWQCIECKSCTICGTSENDDQLLFCDDCDRGFHLYCLKPPLKSLPESDWSCSLCVSAFGNDASINNPRK